MLKNRATLFFAVILSMLACQVVPTPPALRSTPRKLETPTRAPIIEAPEDLSETPTSSPQLEPTITPLPGELAELPYHINIPFSDFQIEEWDQNTQNFEWLVTLPVQAEDVSNLAVADGLTLRQRDQLLRNGFVIVPSQESQFFDQHQRIALFYGQPYLLTTDAAYHALKITWDEVIRALEREELHRRLTEIVRATYQQVVSYFPLVAGSELEPETRLAAAYLGTGLRLLDPEATLEPDLEPLAASQVSQVLAGAGLEEARLLPGFQEDFREYRPRGHYAGDANLESYFRGLTWFERVTFPASEIGPRAYTYHVPLIITMALRQAQTESRPAAAEWAELSEVLDFIDGRRSGGGPFEYALIMDQAFGRRATVLSLQDDPFQATLRSLLRDLPFPPTGAILAPEFGIAEAEKSWSFLGRRNELDELILAKEGANQPTDPDALRWLPGGLELMSVIGSKTAYESLKANGDVQVDFGLIDELNASVNNMSAEQWSQSARNFWLDSYRNRLGEMEINGPRQLPGFASKPGWDYKELNTILGSWAEQQFETSEFVPASDPDTAPDETASPPPPGFVEPNPNVFYQLSRLGFIFAEGLKDRDLTGVFNTNPDPESLNRLTLDLLDLADRLQRLGEIASRELAGEELDAVDFALIQAPLGPAENRLMAQLKSGVELENLDMPPLSGIGGIDYGDRILHFGNGGIDRIYMLVPDKGKIAIAQGGIFSYFEFSLLEDRSLNEQSWRWRLANDPPARPNWTGELYLEEGTPIDVLAYRIGDRYRVLRAAGNLDLRGSPHRDAQIVEIIGEGEEFEIIEGPQEANGLKWWKIRLARAGSGDLEGWIFENQAWIERIWIR